jgi:rhamnogalacturonyl hydrolase YesR
MRSLLLAVFSSVTLAFSARAAEPAAAPQYDFGAWAAGTSPREIGARVADRFLAEGHMKGAPTDHFIISPEVCTWYGALTFAELTNDRSLQRRLVQRFEPIFLPQNAWQVPPANHVDACVFGAVPLEIYRQTHDVRYRMLGLAIADGQWDNPRADGLTNQTRFWIDDMFMITAVQVQAYRATGDNRYLDRAAREMRVYLDQLQQPNGLFYHAPDVPFFWGRGNGWVAAGMAELLRSLPQNHPDRPRILDGYRRMMAILLANQRNDGMWRQLIDRPESWPETSCTGMFTFAFVTGVKQGWLDSATYGPAAKKAWLSLITYLTPDAAIREVCVGTGKKNSLQYYLDRPRVTGDMHGQAPLLWSASAFLR